MELLDQLKNLLRDRAGFEVVDASSTDAQVRLVGRVPANAGSQWVLIVHRLLEMSRKSPWKVDISRNYFLRDLSSGPKLFYAWRLIFQSPAVESHLTEIISVISNSPRPSKVELQEFPLAGVSSRRNELRNGRGAGLVDRTPIGPMALRAGG